MNKSILIIAPHPDDETLGCGGIMGLRVREGYTVHIAVLTDGAGLFREQFGTDTTPSPADISHLRKKETERTVAWLAADPDLIRYVDLPDGSLSEHAGEAIARITALVNELKPGVLYIPDTYEEHPDHNAANVIGKKALEQADHQPALHQYFLALKTGMTFDDITEEITEVDIREVYDLKEQALGMFDCHHKIILPGQTGPLITDTFASYLDTVERFIIRG